MGHLCGLWEAGQSLERLQRVSAAGWGAHQVAWIFNWGCGGLWMRWVYRWVRRGSGLAVFPPPCWTTNTRGIFQLRCRLEWHHGLPGGHTSASWAGAAWRSYPGPIATQCDFSCPLGLADLASVAAASKYCVETCDGAQQVSEAVPAAPHPGSCLHPCQTSLPPLHALQKPQQESGTAA